MVRTYLLRDVSRWHDTLMCRVETMSYDFRSRSGKLRMFDGDCCDMDGCLRLFQSIDPEVAVIDTYSGDKPDTLYRKTDAGWEAKR